MNMRQAFMVLTGLCSLCSTGLTAAVLFALTPFPTLAWGWAVLAGVAVATGAVSMVAAYWMVQPIARRLYAIEEAAVLMGSGRLHHRVATLGEDDEIGRLSTQFNLMGDRLEHQVSLLQKLADENKRLTEEAEMAAALDERQRLARELHDSVSQQLFGLTMLSASAERQLLQESSELPQTIRQIASLAGEAQREMRALLLHLRPLDLDGRTLVGAITAFLAAVEERYHIRCVFETDVSREIGAGIEVNVFRILQEAVANVLKHAEATELQVQLKAHAEFIHLAVLDNGIGIEASEGATPHGDSYGMKAMKERAALLGGRCEVWHRRQGTAVDIHIPVAAAEEESQ